MKDDPKFNISFVQCIEQFECLYNYTMKDYNNKEEQDQAWRIVAWKMESSVSACKERWKNLRASLCRHLRQQAGASGSKTKKPYYLADYMQFVMPYTKIRPLQKSLSHQLESLKKEEPEGDLDLGDGQDYHEGQDYQEGQNYQEGQDFQEGSNYQEGQNYQESQDYHQELENSGFIQDVEDKELLRLTAESPSSSHGNARTGVHNAFKRKALDPMDLCELEYCSKKQRRDIYSENADMLFLRSLIPDIKKMSDKQKISFKRTILASINDILFGSDEVLGPSQSHSPSTCS